MGDEFFRVGINTSYASDDCMTATIRYGIAVGPEFVADDHRRTTIRYQH